MKIDLTSIRGFDEAAILPGSVHRGRSMGVQWSFSETINDIAPETWGDEAR